MKGWTAAENMAALAEGWAIFKATEGNRIEMDDEATVFGNDEEAWAHVVTRAGEGSPLHQRALEHIAATNEREIRRIIETIIVPALGGREAARAAFETLFVKEV